MARSINRILIALLLLAGAGTARAFTLIGQKAEWHILRLGYPDGLIGGPMNINEEYRWTVPAVYYAFTPQFLTYFGSRGTQEVQKALKYLNDLPAASALNINDYPLNVNRVNDRALALGLLDLKSVVLNTLLEEMGLGDPTLNVFTLRKRWIDPGPNTNYWVIQRNFDPVTKSPSPHINGELWTYTGIADGTDESITLTAPVDPLARNNPVTSTLAAFSSGHYFTGLSRDDVGGLKHIYNKNNLNIDSVYAGAFGIGVGGGAVFVGGGSSAWGEVISFPTVTPIGSGSAWSPFYATTNTTVTNGTGGGTVTTNTVVDGALRPGIDKVNFVRINYDTLLGGFTTTNVFWTDSFYTNGVLVRQTAVRSFFGLPDLTFHGADLAGTSQDGVFGTLRRTAAFKDNAALYGNVVGGAPNDNIGPGVIDGPVEITLNTVGPAGQHVWPFFLSEDGAFKEFVWGSFDGTTNAPVVYPVGTLIEDIEAQVLGTR